MESNKQTRIAMAHDAKVLSYAAAYLEADGGISIQIQGPHIRTRYGNGGKVTLKRLADEYGVCEATIFNVVRRRNWRHVK